MSMSRGDKGGQPRCRHICPRLVTPGLLSHFGCCHLQFFLRASLKDAVVWATTDDPVSLNIGVDHPDVKRIIAHRNARLDDIGVPKVIVPIVEVLHFDPTAGLHLRCPFAGARTRIAENGVVVGNLAMLTLTTLFHPPEVGVAWWLSNATVLVLIVNLIRPLRQVRVEVPKRPDGQFFWVNGFCE